jgi:hypothetical protein
MAKLLSALPRIIVPFNAPAGTTLPAGVSILDLTLWGNVVPVPPAPRDVALNIPMFHKFRFDASCNLFLTSHADAVSLESANLQFEVDSTNNVIVTQAGRLSSLTALAQGQSISFDPITIDGYELSFAGALLGANPNLVDVVIQFTFNNTAGAPAGIEINGSFSQQESIYDSYEFPAAP